MGYVSGYFQLAMNVMDILIMVYYMNSIGKAKRVGNVIFWLCNIIYLACISWMNIYVNAAWGNLFISIICIVSISLLYYGGVMERLIWDFVFIGFGLMAELCSVIIIILKEGEFESQSINVYIEGNVLTKIWVLFFVAIIVQYRKEKHIKLPIRTGIIIFLVSLLSMFSSMCFIDTMQYYRGNNIYICMMGVVGLLFINFLIFIFFEQFHSMYQEVIENQQLKYEMENKESYYRQLEENQKEIRTMRHNLKNQLLELNVRLEEREKHYGEIKKEMASDLVNSLLEELEKDKRYSANFLVNVILTEKLKVAKEKNIPVEYEINISEQFQLEQGDMGVILGNLLDNAIEASEKGKNPYIKLFLTQRNNNVTIIIENKVLKETMGGIGNTTKKDRKNHGIGLQSVQKLVEKYGGMIKVEKEDGIFRVQTTFYAP